MMTHLSLFTGIGGIDLAAELAGFETVGQVEWDDYCTKVLEKHWPEVPRWRDIYDFTAESFRERTGLDRPTLISGGFPCQPWSAAGKRRGAEDDRHLWPEMFRVVASLRPDWVFGENIAHFTRVGLDRTLSDLEDEGYTARTFVLPAVAVEAKHERQRVFIVAHSKSCGYGRRACQECGDQKQQLGESEREGSPAWGETERRIVRIIRDQETLPGNLRVDYGLPDWVDRLKCLGNAVVPQQVYPILQAMSVIESCLAEREG